MALSVSGLSASIKTELLNDPDTNAVDGTALTAFCTAIAKAIKDHLEANAEVLPGTFTAGPDPVLGKGTIT